MEKYWGFILYEERNEVLDSNIILINLIPFYNLLILNIKTHKFKYQNQ